MSKSDSSDPAAGIRFKDVYGVFALNPDEVHFRTGCTSGTICVVSDPERRGLLAPMIEKLLSTDAAQRRPWNATERALLEEIIPQLQESGLVEGAAAQPAADKSVAPTAKELTQMRIAVVGHGLLGHAVQAHLAGLPCGAITMIESSSVADGTGARSECRPSPLRRPTDAEGWAKAIDNHDWIVAAQDCFEPEEAAGLNAAALRLSIPWSLVCLDGNEGWVGPTFVPGRTACFTCFRRRLFAGAAEPQHVFMNPGIKVHRVPSPSAAEPAAGPWISLIASLFSLDFTAAVKGGGATLNHLLIVHRLNLTFQRETVLRLPRCPDCSVRGRATRPNIFAQLLSARGNGR
jgi:bacteriocin biosynthesis cyclodehydratase domain-containing protein